MSIYTTFNEDWLEEPISEKALADFERFVRNFESSRDREYVEHAAIRIARELIVRRRHDRASAMDLETLRPMMESGRCLAEPDCECAHREHGKISQPVCGGRRYTCHGCWRRIPWCVGGDDEHCDDCWRDQREAALEPSACCDARTCAP